MEPMLQEYAELLDVDIDVANPHGDDTPIHFDPKRLFIRFWSVPKPNRKATIDRAYGFNLEEGQRDAFKPAKSDDPDWAFDIVDPSGVIVAQVFGDTLYVLFDLPHGNNHARELMEAIMVDYAKQSGKKITPEERERRRAERFAQLKAAAEDNFINLYEVALKSAVEKSDGQINDIRDEVRSYQRSVARLTRRYHEARIAKSNTERLLKEKDRAKIKADFEALKALTKDNEMIVYEDRLEFHVGQIDIAYRDAIYDIGDFTVVLYPDGSHGGVRCVNNTRSYGNYFHPHVYADGECCLGNISELVPKLVGEMDYSTALSLMVQYLKTFSPHGHYVDVLLGFPFKEAEEAKK